MGVLWLLVAAGQLALAVLLCAAALYLIRAALAAAGLPPLSSAPAAPAPPAADAQWVTVQLPLRNERALCQRLIAVAAALDWPAGRLEIQVLDDSDDDTRGLVDEACRALAAAGRPARVLRRPGRAGFKAGALQLGLASARGEFLLVLDADMRPDPDLVRRLIAPLLADPQLAFAQGRWTFDNRDASLLTRVQALILDGLMLVEQPLLSARRLPVQFNGTAGLWRRSLLEDAGGWLGGVAGASVTEDLDLSYRARLRGHLGVSLPEVAVLTELPETMAAFRAQQQRWVRGGAEVLRALGRRLWRGDLPRRERLTMLGHLARHARQPLLLFATAWLPASTASALSLPLAGAPWAAVVVLALGAVAAYQAAAERRIGRGPLEALALSPVVLALSMGMSLMLTVAFVRGLLGGSGEFVRTPKGGGYRARRDSLWLVETAIGATTLVAAAISVAAGQVIAGAALALLVGAGYLWVGLATGFGR